jgi:hypothetical protein
MNFGLLQPTTIVTFTLMCFAVRALPHNPLIVSSANKLQPRGAAGADILDLQAIDPLPN